MTLLDLRHEQSPTGPDGAGKVVRGRLAIREPLTVDALCLHQTAVRFGASSAAVAKAKGDKVLARHRRALNVHAHVTAFDDGTFVAAYPLRAYVWHGNGANARSIGLEVEGLYNGIPGGSGVEPSDLTIETAREACTWIVEAAKAEGCTIRYVVAHRQYAASRRADPGWAIWQRVAMEHCEKVLGLALLPDLTDRDGRPIPRMWDRRQTDGY